MNELTSLLDAVYASSMPAAEDLEKVLSLTEEADLQTLFSYADRVRREHMGDGVLLRGIVEFSNFCRNTCLYCGINRYNTVLERYRLTDDELMESVGIIAQRGIKTVVLQSGEEDELDPARLADAVRRIKERFGMAVTLSVGERSIDDYRLWREAGADRYLLKIETTDRALYDALHPGMSYDNRVRCLDDLAALGYQVGSGILIGLPRQTVPGIARDIQFFKGRDFDMIGIGPFIPHAETRLKDERKGDVLMTLKAVALTRIVTRDSHLPGTTALGSMDRDYRVDALKAGANVLMPNFTPVGYKKLYEIYPGKRCVTEETGSCAFCMEGMASSVGRHIDYSTGHSVKKKNG